MRVADKLLVLTSFALAGALLAQAAGSDDATMRVALGAAAGLLAHHAYAIHRDAKP